MDLIEDETSSPLISGVKAGKTNKTRPIRMRQKRETSGKSLKRSPEVLVKISGFTKGGHHLDTHMAYVSRKGKVEMQDEEGNVFSDLDAIRDLAKRWQMEIDEGNPPKSNRRDAVRIVLSMPPGTDPMALKRAARKFSKENFANHAFVFALHTDEEHPHLTVQMRGFDGERLNPRKKELQEWRESFSACLLNEGVDCVATPRTSMRQVATHQMTKDRTNPKEEAFNL